MDKWLKKIKPDSVAVAGSITGIIACIFGWLAVKPDRLSEGTSLNIIDSLGSAWAIIIICLWLICLFLSISNRRRWQVLLCGILANAIFIILLVSMGVASNGLVEGLGGSTRVSLAAGIWVTLLALYVLLFAIRQKLKEHQILKNLISWPGPVLFLIFIFSGFFNSLSIVMEYDVQKERFLQELLQHLFLVGISVAIGMVLGVFLGIWANRSKRVEKPVFFIVNITQTIPSLALFGLLIAPLSALSFTFPVLRDIGIRGIGDTPAIIALVIYSLLPIVTNTYTGIKQLDQSIINAGKGMGMSRFQILQRIEIPLSFPVVLAGIRIAAVQSVGLAAVAALIGAGGLGWFIFQGLGQAAPDMILLGTIPLIFMAIVIDFVMRIVIRLTTPRGLTEVTE
jgi:osmoprotectant transport system permease protein